MVQSVPAASKTKKMCMLECHGDDDGVRQAGELGIAFQSDTWKKQNLQANGLDPTRLTVPFTPVLVVLVSVGSDLALKCRQAVLVLLLISLEIIQ